MGKEIERCDPDAPRFMRRKLNRVGTWPLVIEYKGFKGSIKKWAFRLGLTSIALRIRLYHAAKCSAGWTYERALTEYNQELCGKRFGKDI